MADDQLDADHRISPPYLDSDLLARAVGLQALAEAGHILTARRATRIASRAPLRS